MKVALPSSELRLSAEDLDACTSKNLHKESKKKCFGFAVFSLHPKKSDAFFTKEIDKSPRHGYIHTPKRGNNSVVECNLAKVEVAGSNPVSRSTGDMAKW